MEEEEEEEEGEYVVVYSVSWMAMIINGNTMRPVMRGGKKEKGKKEKEKSVSYDSPAPIWCWEYLPELPYKHVS